MAIEFRLPDVGEGLAEAEIVRWLVPVGGAVREDDAIVEVETDKAIVQITAPVTGTLTSHGAEEGQVLPVGEVLATFEAGDGAGAPAASAPSPAAAASTAAAPAASAVPVPTPVTAAPGARAKAAPATRGLARRLGVDLSTVVGTGPGGRIVDADVEAAAKGRAPAPAAPPAAAPASAPRPAPAPLAPIEPPVGEDRRVPLRGVRKAIARNMLQSWTTVPHVSSMHEVDLHELVGLRSQLRARDRDVPMTAFLVRAAALALREFPVLNAVVDDEREELVLRHRVNIGVAVDAPDGLIVPVIDDADRKDLHRIGIELRELAAQARDRSVPAERLRGGTFTVNNYGPLGGWFGTSLVRPGEAGILSIGPARDQVVPRDGEIVIRPVAAMVLAADHRVADGREIIGFCLAVRGLLEAPVNLLLEG